MHPKEVLPSPVSALNSAPVQIQQNSNKYVFFFVQCLFVAVVKQSTNMSKGKKQVGRMTVTTQNDEAPL